MVLNAHDIENRLDDLYAIFFRLRWRYVWLFAEQADDHADGEMALYGDAADGVDRIQKSRVLRHKHRPVTRGIEPGANRYPFVFFTNLHDVKLRIGKQPLEQIVTGHAVRQCHDEMDSSALEFFLNRLGCERVIGHESSKLSISSEFRVSRLALGGTRN